MSGITGATLISFPGINISRLTFRISRGQVDLNSRHLILHVGTNDINSLLVPEIVASYNDLISVVRDNSVCDIVVSAVLPRPIDHDKNGEKVKDLNKKLKTLCIDRQCKFVKTFKPFLHAGEPRRELYAVRDGGLHLNWEGCRRLRQFFINCVAHLS